jgi:hypothetical protein
MRSPRRLTMALPRSSPHRRRYSSRQETCRPRQRLTRSSLPAIRRPGFPSTRSKRADTFLGCTSARNSSQGTSSMRWSRARICSPSLRVHAPSSSRLPNCTVMTSLTADMDTALKHSLILAFTARRVNWRVSPGRVVIRQIMLLAVVRAGIPPLTSPPSPSSATVTPVSAGRTNSGPLFGAAVTAEAKHGPVSRTRKATPAISWPAT